MHVRTKLQPAAERQYFDMFNLTKAGVATDMKHVVKRKLGCGDTQRFSGTMVDAVSQVVSSNIDDDYCEGFNALNNRPRALKVEKWMRFMAV